jgi:sugar lactone lactonase YvrE
MDIDVPPTPSDAAVPSLPPIDASSHEAAAPAGCADASATLVYTLTDTNDLYTFDPSSLVFSPVGKLACNAGTATPFSMAVDRQGIGYSVFAFSGALFRLHMTSALCDATPYVPNQQGFNVFGMGYVAMPNGGETLYVTDNEYGGPLSKGLAWIDTTTFALHFIAPFSLPVQRGELTGTADGRLFMFYANSGRGSHLAQVDPSTASILAQDDLALDAAGAAWAFAYWGGDFWIFSSQAGPSTVTRFTPSTHAEVSVATAPGQIVGAGVSTCAPQ